MSSAALLDRVTEVIKSVDAPVTLTVMSTGYMHVTAYRSTSLADRKASLAKAADALAKAGVRIDRHGTFSLGILPERSAS